MFRGPARISASNGLYQGDYVPDALSDKLTPYATRPLSIVAAIRWAVAGNPRVVSPLAEEALLVLAKRLEVAGDGPFRGAVSMVEFHVDGWGDAPGRTTESTAAVLYADADAAEVTA
ncbi:hypothetical protein ACFXI8_27115 [Streptomyces niveus]|uniref:DUF6197 family protein n=1 Tax=Streptomyces niveus TaxID=193462 RepID=UPI0036B0EA0B